MTPLSREDVVPPAFCPRSNGAALSRGSQAAARNNASGANASATSDNPARPTSRPRTLGPQSRSQGSPIPSHAAAQAAAMTNTMSRGVTGPFRPPPHASVARAAGAHDHDDRREHPTTDVHDVLPVTSPVGHGLGTAVPNFAASSTSFSQWASSSGMPPRERTASVRRSGSPGSVMASTPGARGSRGRSRRAATTRGRVPRGRRTGRGRRR